MLKAKTIKADIKRIENMKLFSVKECGIYTKLAPATLNAWRVEGVNKGPRFLKLGSRVVYRKCDVDAWLEKQLVITEEDDE